MERHCTLLINLRDVKSAATQIDEITSVLEKGSDDMKIEAMKSAIKLIISGVDMSPLMMVIIRYCLMTENKELKKIIHLYWEAVPKHGSDGNLRSEVILACNALRKDLIHPNEYICGNTLRFLCKLHEPDLLQPLVPSILEALEHRSAYVRSNAVVTTYIIYKNFPDLIDNAPELLEEMLLKEKDEQARRNAFLMLFYAKPSAAVYYLMENIEDLEDSGSGFQLAVLEVGRKVSRSDPTQKSKFIQVIFELLQSDEPIVMYEAAVSLVSLSSSATAVRASAQCLCQLLATHSDNNVKLIVIDQLNMLKKRHRKVLQELVGDILRALAIPNFDIRKRALSIATDLLSPQNIEIVIQKLKKELRQSQSESDAEEYRAQLAKTLHSCAVKFPFIANVVVHMLLETLCASKSSSSQKQQLSAVTVIHYVRDITQTYENLREDVVNRLIEIFSQLSQPAVLEVVFWMLGEYCESVDAISRSFDAIQNIIGPLPLTAKIDESAADISMNHKNDEDQKDEKKSSSSGPKVLADGTYASQSAALEIGGSADSKELDSDEEDDLVLRRIFTKGNEFFIATSMSAALTKMVLRVFRSRGETDQAAKQMSVQVLLIICSVLEIGERRRKMGKTTSERLRFCVRSLLDPVARKSLSDVWLKCCRSSFANLLKEKSDQDAIASKEAEDEDAQKVSPDRQITFRHLCSSQQVNFAIDLDDDFDLGSATNIGGVQQLSRLDRMHQLTGFGDPVYAEATITVHDYDIVMDITILNRTEHTLNNLTVELSTRGDLKLIDRPQNYTVPPGAKQDVKTSIKVSSTETGHVFGSIVYDVYKNGTRRQVVVNLQDIHIDIMDYIFSAKCTDRQFRQMWAEFEWENKVAVNTSFTDIDEFLNHVMAITNMNCLTPMAVTEDCNFLAANLYAQSVFGEDALLNLSVEKRAEDTGEIKLHGYMRIRSKTQGIALSLGDRLQAKQRNPLENKK